MSQTDYLDPLALEPETIKHDELIILEFYRAALAEDTDKLEALNDDLYQAMLRLNRFRLWRLRVYELREYDKFLFDWFREAASGDTEKYDLYLMVGWGPDKVDRYLFELTPPFIRPDIKIPFGVEYYYGLSADAYASGNDEACLALCRATLEGILKEKMGKKLDERYPLSFALTNLRNEGRIDDVSFQLASSINAQANSVLHKLKKAKSGAWKALDTLKHFIETFYGYKNLEMHRGE